MKRLYCAFLNSAAGLRTAFHDEKAFQQEIIACVFLFPLAFYLAEDGIRLALMAGSLFLILVAELMNTGIEAAIDRHGGEIHPLSKKAKDVGSAAVLICMINAAFVWTAVLFF